MHKQDWISRKIFKDATLFTRYCNTLRARGQKIVFTNGVFDILHHGHFDYLARAADLGNALVIGVNSDASVKRLKGESRPVNKEDDRLFQLASLLCVEAVCLFEEDTPLELIEAVRPEVLAKGGDYTIDTIIGAKETLARGGAVEVIDFVDGYSTTGLIERMKG